MSKELDEDYYKLGFVCSFCTLDKSPTPNLAEHKQSFIFETDLNLFLNSKKKV